MSFQNKVFHRCLFSLDALPKNKSEHGEDRLRQNRDVFRIEQWSILF